MHMTADFSEGKSFYICPQGTVVNMSVLFYKWLFHLFSKCPCQDDRCFIKQEVTVVRSTVAVFSVSLMLEFL